MIAYISMPGRWELLVIAVLLLIPLGGAVVRYFCARIVGIRQPTFLRALGCSILAPLAYFPIWLLMRLIPVVGPVLALLIGLLVDGLITRAIFRTTYGRALAAVALTWAIQAILVAIVSRLLALAGITPIRDSGMEDDTTSRLLPAGRQLLAYKLPSCFPLPVPPPPAIILPARHPGSTRDERGTARGGLCGCGELRMNALDARPGERAK